MQAIPLAIDTLEMRLRLRPSGSASIGRAHLTDRRWRGFCSVAREIAPKYGRGSTR
jgi:hypothetical protein